MFGFRVPRSRFSPKWALISAIALGSGCGGGEDGPVAPPAQYTVGGSIAGLSGTGLALNLNGGADLPVAAGASTFTFANTVSSGSPFNVIIKAQPTNPTQTCALTGSSGTVSANVTSVGVACTTNRYAIGGTVSGLTGTGLTLLLNGGSPITISAGTAGFSFPAVASGTAYTVTVGTQPAASSSQNPPQTCSVTNGTGVVGANSISNVAVTCVAVSYTIGGTVSGLTGTGLVLQNNGGNEAAIAGGSTTFSFSNTVTAGAGYNVTVKTQPSSPSQTCTVANASGVANGNVLVAVSCVSNSLTVSGTVSGLTGTGLSLLLNGASPLSISAGAPSFAFPTTVAAGSSYAVAIAAHPSGQTCSVNNGSGTVGTVGVTGVALVCTANAANTWLIGGAISGLTSAGLVLVNGNASIGVASGTTLFALPAMPSGAAYNVTVGTQPASNTCTVNNGSGTVGGSNVNSVSVNCQPTTYTIGGTVSGYTGTGLRLLLNGGNSRLIAAGATTFVLPGLQSGASYEVTVGAQPTNPAQSCTVSNGVGIVGNANVVNVAVTCINTVSVGGSIVNLNGSGLVLLLNGGSPLPRVVDQGTFTFSGLPTGVPYTVTVGTQPSSPAQTCNVTNGGGTTGTTNVTNITVTCINNGPVIGGSISGYNGTGLMLRINGGAPVPPQTNTKFTFPDLFPPGTNFSASIASQPAGQTCTLTRGSGVIQQPPNPNNVQNLLVQCMNNATSPLSGTYSVLIGGKRNYLTFWADGTYTYASRLDDAACGVGSGNGVEYGVYNWNAATGAFAFLTGPVDSNGSCGMYSSAAGTGQSGTLTKSSATLTLALNGGTLVLNPVSNAASAYVGSFQAADEQNGGFLVLQSDNTYLAVQTQFNPTASNGAPIGYERGCFTATATTLTFSLSASCQPDGFPALDLNGRAGVSDDLGVPIPYVMTGPNTMTFAGDAFLVRILFN